MADVLMKEEDARILASRAAPVVASAFREHGWELRGIAGEPTTEQVETAIFDMLCTAAKPHGRFLPQVIIGKLRVEILPDLRVGQVWILAADLQWPAK